MRGFIGKQYLAATVLVGAVTLPLSNVHAQDAKDVGDYDAKGISMGSFRALPKVELSATSDSNIYQEKTGETSDVIYKAKPSLAINSDWNNHAFNINLSAIDARYRTNSADNFTTYDINADGRIDASKALKVNLNAGHQTLSDERGGKDVASDSAAPTDSVKQTAGTSLEYKPNRFGFTAGGDLTDYNYDDTKRINGTMANNDDRDRRDTEWLARIGYDIQDGYEAYASYKGNNRNYDAAVDDAGVNRDSSGYNTQAGLKVELTRLLTADLSVGYMSQDYTARALKDVSGWSGDANIRWSVTPLTTLRATLGRSIGETTTANVSSTLDTSYGIGVDHEFLRNLTAKADIKFANSDYQGVSTRDDDTRTISAGLDYKLNRMFFAGVDAKFENRNSSISTNDYSRRQLMAKVGAQF